MIRLLAILFVGLLIVSEAQAQSQNWPFAYAGTTSDSGTVTTGGTSQTAIAANPGRRGFCVENPGGATEDLFFDFGRAASLTASFDLVKGNWFCQFGPGVWTGTVTVNATTTAHAFIAYEFF